MSKKLTTSDFQNRLNEIYGDQFIVKSDYINNVTKIDILCTHCGNVIQKSPVKMTGVTREGCYICSGKNHYKTKETLQSEVDKKFPDSYIIIGEYIKAREPLAVKRTQCGHVYNVSPDNLLRGKGCPRCSIRQSKYMDIVENYLDTHNIKYEKEKRFDDCKYIRVLPFDYYIPDFNLCIEVDGEFHYYDNTLYKYGNNNTELKLVQKRDQIKTKYCEDNDIKLLRLPYYEKDYFENILENIIC